MKNDDIAAILNDMADEATSVCSYAAGLSDGLKTAAMVLKKKSTNTALAAKSIIEDQERRPKHKTQAPVIDLLRQHGPLTVTELVHLAKSDGHDLLRPSVSAALNQLERHGLVSSRQHRYQLTSFED
ncbi:MAG: hypothetical protein HWE25_14315 [Alphaproteobacteria bacterium]|nr:hypothetical protein [Alphaproteobacteria bacterium]